MQNILIMFMIYGIIGWCWETPYESIRQKKFVNRGFLYGPMIPIYGVACVIIMSSMNFIAQYLLKQNVLMIIISILYIAIIASSLEYITSYALEAIFKTRWWDYSDMRLNLNGRIALLSSIFWGVGGYIFWRFVHLPLMGTILKIPPKYVLILLSITYTVFVIDFIITLRQLFALQNTMKTLHYIYNELSGKVGFSVQVVHGGIKERKEQFKQSFSEKKQGINEQILLLTTKRGITLSTRQKGLLDKFNSLLEKGKGFGRFYNNYPKAYSSKFKKLLKVIRYKRDTEK